MEIKIIGYTSKQEAINTASIEDKIICQYGLFFVKDKNKEYKQVIK
jgi:hypothetical protein